MCCCAILRKGAHLPFGRISAAHSAEGCLCSGRKPSGPNAPHGNVGRYSLVPYTSLDTTAPSAGTLVASPEHTTCTHHVHLSTSFFFSSCFIVRILEMNCHPGWRCLRWPVWPASGRPAAQPFSAPPQPCPKVVIPLLRLASLLFRLEVS